MGRASCWREYGFDYTSLVDDDVRRGGLADRFDAVLLPHQTTRQIAHGHNPSHYPPDYSGGLGAAGADSLKDLVEQGGTLIAWDGADEYAIQHLDLPVRDALASVPSTEFYAPGSLLRILVDTSHPIGYGLPEECAAMFVSGPAFETGAGTVVAKYPQDSLAVERVAGGTRASRGSRRSGHRTVGIGRGGPLSDPAPLPGSGERHLPDPVQRPVPQREQRARLSAARKASGRMAG